MVQIAEAYIHIREPAATLDTVRSFGRATDLIAYEAARRVYSFDIQINVRIEDGSLKTWAEGAMLTASILTGIANYSALKTSVKEMVLDAKSFGTLVTTQFTDQTGTPTDHIIRVERRSKTPGALNRVLKRIERLELQVRVLPPNEMEAELKRIHQALARIFDDLSESDAERVRELLEAEHQPKLPMPLMPRIAINPREQDYLPPSASYDLLPEYDSKAEYVAHFKAAKEAPKASYYNSFNTAQFDPRSPEYRAIRLSGQLGRI